MISRIRQVRELMKEENIDGLIIDSNVNRFYLTGFTGTAGRILFTPNNNYFITDFRYREQARQQVEGCEIVEINKDIIENTADILHNEEVSSLGFEAETVTYQQYEKYRDKFQDIELKPTEGLIEKLRLIKDESEVKKIEEAVRISEKAFSHILEYIKPGITEREVALELEFFQKKNGGSKNAFEFIVASGKRSSMPHGAASDKKLEEGDFITMDFGTVYEGYCSDLTRTVVLGQPTSRQKEIYNLVLQAQKKVIDDIKPGMTTKEADAIARNIIKQAGFGDNFKHGTGHGLGIEVHEAPRVSYTEEEELKPGMVISDEPGIYITDWGGVRIEDDLLITEAGCRVLSRAAKGLIEI